MRYVFKVTVHDEYVMNIDTDTIEEALKEANLQAQENLMAGILSSRPQLTVDFVESNEDDFYDEG